MILMPVVGGTRSSLVAGIFVACGAWVGETRLASRNNGDYDTFENFFVVTALNGLREGMKHDQKLAFVRKLVKFERPTGYTMLLKYHYRYHLLMRQCFPCSHTFGVERHNPKFGVGRMKPYRTEMRQRGIALIDTDILMPPRRDFSQIRQCIESVPTLEWDEQAVRGVYKK